MERREGRQLLERGLAGDTLWGVDQHRTFLLGGGVQTTSVAWGKNVADEERSLAQPGIMDPVAPSGRQRVYLAPLPPELPHLVPPPE